MKRTTLSLVAVLLTLCVAGGWYRLLHDPGADMTTAAEAFLASLDEQQRSRAVHDYNSSARLQWHFIPLAERKGLQIKEMSEPQRQAAHALLKAALSQIGYKKATGIMAMEAILAELEKNRRNGPIRDPERYYFTVYGTPQTSGLWATSIEGHHLSLNFTIEDGKVISHTPAAFGANPATVQHVIAGGPAKGTRYLAQEEELGFKLVNSLDEQQRATALIAEKALGEVRGAGDPQPAASEPQGLPASQMTPAQRDTLLELLAVYAGNMAGSVGEAKLAEIRSSGVDNIHFAWAGAREPGIGHYYCIQGPTFVVEFVNVQPDAAGNPANHIHTLWRDIRGDFGTAR